MKERVIGWVTGRRRIVRDSITKLGVALAATVVVSFTIGYQLGWREFIAVAWAGSVLAIIAVLSLARRSLHQVVVVMPTQRVVVGEPASGALAVDNPTRRRLSGVTVEVPIGEHLAEFPVASLAGGSSASLPFAVPTERRGVIRVGPACTIRQDPLRLLRRTRRHDGALEIFVHPRVISIPSTSTGLIHDLEGNPTRDLTSSDVSFHALREYQPGDERRHIHWRSTARTGTAMVRQFEQSRRSHLLVVLVTAQSAYATGDEFELAVSVAGSLGIRAIRDARQISVIAGAAGHTPDRELRPLSTISLSTISLSTVSRNRLLDDLSRVELSEQSLSASALASGVDSAGISVAFLVVGSAVTGAELWKAAARFPAGVSVVAVVCDVDASPSLRRMREVTVLTIGYLEDLHKSLARRAQVA